jgi:hypothetical protein
MNIQILVAIAVLSPAFASAQVSDLLKGAQDSDVAKSVSDSVTDSLPSLLQGQLGISKDQAEGGLGSLLSLASENLDVSDFDKLKGMIPGAGGYIDAAKSLGALAGPLKNLDGLNAALGKLGISPDVIAKFVPTVMDYVGKMGGADATKLLQSALGMG